MDRRGFLKGLAGVVAAPAVIRVIDLMPVKTVKPGFIMMKPGVYYREWEMISVEYKLNAITHAFSIPRELLLGENLDERPRYQNTKAELDRKLWCRLEKESRTTQSLFREEV